MILTNHSSFFQEIGLTSFTTLHMLTSAYFKAFNPGFNREKIRFSV